jgi:hypothetical protein
VTGAEGTPAPNRRPPSVTGIAWLFIAAGSVGLVYHATKLRVPGPLDPEMVWVLVLRLLAIVGGPFLLRGAGWARWLLLAWIAYHVVLSAIHSWSDTLVHAVLLALIAYGLLRADAAAYFRGTNADHGHT